MKIFIDTNIFLDLLLDREYSTEAKSVLLSIQEGLFEAITADISLLNIDYIAKKQTKNIRHFIDYINQIVVIVGADNNDIAQALHLDNKDFEDNLQLVLAKRSNCDLIITNDLKFPKEGAKIISSTNFVEQYL